jgi:hypothetical protein
MSPDERLVSDLYRTVRRDRLPLHPLVIDVRRASPASGVAYAEFPSATERLACELVLALSVVDELVLRLPATHVAQTIAGFARGCALVEVPAPDRLREVTAVAGSPCFTAAFEQQLTEALARAFGRVERLSSGPYVALLCRR